jgi:hypothetical protein
MAQWPMVDGARTVESVRRWWQSYMTAYLRLAGRAAERGHRLADAWRYPQFCRPRPRPRSVEVAPVVSGGPVEFVAAARAAAAAGSQIATELLSRRA